MTLVVSKIIDGKLRAYADSMITFGVLPGDKMTLSMLKMVIINSKTCVYYAGAVVYANSAIKEILDKKEITENQIIGILKKYTILSNQETIFGIAVISEKNKMSQKKIISGKVIECDESILCLGNPTAEEEFKKSYEKNVQKNRDEDEAMKAAFKEIIKNPNITNVGHFLIEMRSTNKVMKNEIIFDYNVDTFVGNKTPQNIPTNISTPLVVGNPRKDLFGILCFTSISLDYFSLAIYSIEENRGLLLCPQLQLGIIPEFDVVAGRELRVEAQDFIDQIYKKYKIPLRGFVYNSDVLGVKMIENCKVDESKFYSNIKIKIQASLDIPKNSKVNLQLFKNKNKVS